MDKGMKYLAVAIVLEAAAVAGTYRYEYERLDTRGGPITVGGSVTIHDWPDHSVN